MPNRIICPDDEELSNWTPSIWSIMNKVRLESFYWGVGVAIGELPPFFMGRASRLSGFDPDDEDDLKEFQELKEKRDRGVELSLLERGKIWMERAVENIGFVGILICASVSVIRSTYYAVHAKHFTLFNIFHSLSRSPNSFRIHCLMQSVRCVDISSCHSGHSSVRRSLANRSSKFICRNSSSSYCSAMYC